MLARSLAVAFPILLLPSVALSRTPEVTGPSFTLAAVGDVSLMEGKYDADLDRIGASFLDDARPWLHEATVRFLNLETTVTDRPFATKKEYLFRMPARRLAWILDAGFNLLSLANNHMADAGPDGVKDTEAHLAKAIGKRKVAWAGTGSHEGGDTLDVPGGKVRFLAVSCTRAPLVAKAGPGTESAIRAARKRGEFVVVSAHCGAEYRHEPDPGVVRLYRGFVDAGASVVLGHHPHVVQGVEPRGNGVIFYSLGNFAMASRTVRHKKTGARMYGMIGLVRVEHGSVRKVRIVPLWVSNSEPLVIGKASLGPTPFRPLVARGVFAKAILEELDAFSAAIAGNPGRIRPDGDTGILEGRKP